MRRRAGLAGLTAAALLAAFPAAADVTDVPVEAPPPVTAPFRAAPGSRLDATVLRAAQQLASVPYGVPAGKPVLVAYIAEGASVLYLLSFDASGVVTRLGAYPTSPGFGTGPTGNARSGSHATPYGVHRLSARRLVPFAAPDPARVGMQRWADVRGRPFTADAVTDSITTAYFRMHGLEPGFNDNSAARGIGIHGTWDEGRLGQSVSHGCLRVPNVTALRFYEELLFGDEADPGTLVAVVGPGYYELTPEQRRHLAAAQLNSAFALDPETFPQPRRL